MFNLTFNGRFELENPSEFLQDMQGLLDKHKASFYGNVHQENLGQYVDFQKIEEPTKDE